MWSFHILPQKRKTKSGCIPDAFPLQLRHCMSTYLPTYLPACLSTCLPVWLPASLQFYFTAWLPFWLPLWFSTFLDVCLTANLVFLLPVYLSSLLTDQPALVPVSVWYCAGWISRSPVRPFPPFHPSMSVLFSLRSWQCERETCHTKLLLYSPCYTMPITGIGQPEHL